MKGKVLKLINKQAASLLLQIQMKNHKKDLYFIRIRIPGLNIKVYRVKTQVYLIRLINTIVPLILTTLLHENKPTRCISNRLGAIVKLAHNLDNRIIVTWVRYQEQMVLVYFWISKKQLYLKTSLIQKSLMKILILKNVIIVKGNLKNVAITFQF